MIVIASARTEHYGRSCLIERQIAEAHHWRNHNTN
jgi:hypothetical protein